MCNTLLLESFVLNLEKFSERKFSAREIFYQASWLRDPDWEGVRKRNETIRFLEERMTLFPWNKDSEVCRERKEERKRWGEGASGVCQEKAPPLSSSLLPLLLPPPPSSSLLPPSHMRGDPERELWKKGKGRREGRREGIRKGELLSFLLPGAHFGDDARDLPPPSPPNLYQRLRFLVTDRCRILRNGNLFYVPRGLRCSLFDRQDGSCAYYFLREPGYVEGEDRGNEGGGRRRRRTSEPRNDSSGSLTWEGLRNQERGGERGEGRGGECEGADFCR
jgi:hypothetical protein